jgi:zinc D-Ala-D-Ala carboxypeptidase
MAGRICPDQRTALLLLDTVVTKKGCFPVRALHPLLLFSAILLFAACGVGPAAATPTGPGTTIDTTASVTTPTRPPLSPTATTVPSTPTPGPAQISTPQPAPPTPASSSAPVACGDILAPLDKQHSLAADCQPPDLVPLPDSMSYLVDYPIILRRAAADAMVSLVNAAADAGFTLKARSAYRSYAQQQVVFNYWVSVDGYDQAVRVSAEPGHSEHQLGTAADVTSASSGYGFDYFDGTPDAAWLAENCWKVGYILSYPAGTESITGYAYEPWHVRYVGTDVAARVRASGLTLHQFLLQR